jgi:hypothetical protein
MSYQANPKIKSCTVHIVYKNNSKLYLGYGEEMDFRIDFQLTNDDETSVLSAVKIAVYELYKKCKTFEDFPLAYMEFNKNVMHLQWIMKFGAHRELTFKPLHEVIGVKPGVDMIDLAKDYKQYWNSDYMFFINLTNETLVMYSRDDERMSLASCHACMFTDGCDPVLLLDGPI